MMVDLPQPSREIVTSKAPQSQLSPSEVAQPGLQRGQAFEKLGDAVEDFSVPLAQRQAASDLNQQRVTRDANGAVQILNPANSVIFGKAGEAYASAVRDKTVADVASAFAEDFTGLHNKFANDPQGFKSASDAYLQKWQQQNGDSIIGQAALRHGQQLQSEHFDNIANSAAMLNRDNAKKSIEAQIADQQDTLLAMAGKPGAANLPEFQQASAKLDAARQALAGNPLFNTPQSQIDLDNKHFNDLLRGTAVVAGVDDTFTRKGRADAQKELTESVLNNADLHLSPLERNTLYRQGMSRLEFLTGDQKAQIDASKAITADMEGAMAKGQIRAEDPSVSMAIQRARSIGDSESVQRMQAAAFAQFHMRGITTLPSARQAQILGMPGELTGKPENVGAGPPQAGGVASGFDAVVAQTMRFEGGKTVDTGGPTNFGISQNANPDVNVNSLTADQAKAIYKTRYWDAIGGDNLSPQMQAVAFDAAVNAGVGRAKEWLAESGGDPQKMLALREAFNARLIGSDPGTYGKYAQSWQNRINTLRAGLLGGAPAANGGPSFTYDQVKQNPFLLSAYVKSIASDPEGRMEAVKGTAAAIGKSVDAGIRPPPASVAMIYQAAEKEPQKYGFIADEVKGKLAALDAGGMSEPEKQAYSESVRQYAQGADIHHQAIAAAALTQFKEQSRQEKEAPYAAAAARGWIAPPPLIDPSQPDSIAPALAKRAEMANYIGHMNGSPPPGLIQKDDMPAMQAALQGQNGAQVLGQIAQTIKPADMGLLTGEEGFRSAVTGMSRSGDPAKMNAAYSFMDKLQRQNPLEFDAQFKDGLRDLRAWQANLSFYPPDVAAKRMMAQFDPANSEAQDAVKKVADEALKNVSAANVVSKFSTGFGPITLTRAQAPASEMNGVAAEALRADYAENYRSGFAATGDAASADKFAMEKLQLKYAISPANGNRVTAYPPERYYPQVDGSFDWMGRQLDSEIAKALNVGDAGPALKEPGALPVFGGSEQQQAALRTYLAPRAIVSDAATQADIAAGRAPSYSVIVQDPNGRFNAMAGADGKPMRFRFDPKGPQADLAAQAEHDRAGVDWHTLQGM